ILAVAVLGAGGWVGVESLTSGDVVRHALAWPEVAAALVGASLVTVTFVVRGTSVAIGLMEIPLVVGVVYLHPQGLLLAAVTAQVVIGLWKRRSPSRMVFNILSYVVATAVAVAAYHAVAGEASPVSVRGWLACAAAAVVANGTLDVTVFAVVGVSTWRWPRAEMLTAMRATATSLPIAVVVVLSAVNAIWASRLAFVLFAGLGVMAALGQRSSTELRRRYANLERLYRFAERTSGLAEVDDVVVSILRHAREVIGAGVAELVLPDGPACLSYQLDADDQLISSVREDQGGFARLVHAAGVGMVASRVDGDADVDEALTERDLRNAMAAPITFGDDLRGVLIVGNRLTSGTFDAEDLRLFEVLATHSAVAIRGGRLLDRLRREVTAREHEALHDGLTGLANRNLFDRYLETTLRERSVGRLVAVMLMDLNGFKEINDTMGHHIGDSVLREVAARLTGRISEHGIVARLGGDEFGFVLPDLADVEQVGDMSRAVLEELVRPVTVDGIALEMRASLGVTVAPEHGEEHTILLRRADIAMYAAKSAGGGIEVYDPSGDRHSTRRLILANELRAAPRTDAIEVWYQPVADLASGQVLGCEALMRWNHSLHGSIPPDEFIPLAEQSGIIGELTWWMLDAAIRQVREWQDRGLALGVSVNVTARTLLEADLLDRLAQLLAITGVEARWLTLELTESSIMADPDRSSRVLAALGDLGVRIAIDDFGTGYSSLTRLKQLPIHVVKIDKSFVMSMCVDEGDGAIVRSTIELARNLGHVVVAEGVEDQATWDQLAALGCDWAQGFYLARPMRAPLFDIWLRQRRRGHLSVVPPAESATGA
ncbi:MAG TPA: GGDEF domain-containing protein, partial [Acidimicrobiales bacterium]